MEKEKGKMSYPEEEEEEGGGNRENEGSSSSEEGLRTDSTDRGGQAPVGESYGDSHKRHI